MLGQRSASAFLRGTDMSGTRLGRWILDRELGRGGMGRVFLAREESGERQAAVKVLAAELATDPGFVHRFHREIHALSQLDHSHIVHFYESGVDQGRFFYAMEYIEGQSLEELLHLHGRLPWTEVLELAVQICPALKHAHDRGIIHRDLKPANLLRTKEGQVKLADFGIAKVFASTHLTDTGGVVGTAEYLSPEQATGKPVTKRSDLYSLGVVLYTLLTGRPPFEGESVVELLQKHRFAQFDRPQTVVPEIPHDLDEVVCQLLEKDPARRPADGQVLGRLLDRIQRKLARRTQPTAAGEARENTLAENPSSEPDPPRSGSATLMGRLLRQELHRQNRGGPLSQLLSQPWVVAPLFLLCVGIIIWSLWRPSADSQGSAADSEATTAADRVALRRSLAAARNQSAAQRFYQRGLSLCQHGDLEAARRVWSSVVRTFQGIASEQRWVQLAEEGLAELNQQGPAVEQGETSVREALQRAIQLRDQGKRTEAEAIWSGLEALYAGDSAADGILQEVRRDRGK
jgi:serine/threonine protein kinase